MKEIILVIFEIVKLMIEKKFVKVKNFIVVNVGVWNLELCRILVMVVMFLMMLRNVIKIDYVVVKKFFLMVIKCFV